jgi:hypothetical protein
MAMRVWLALVVILTLWPLAAEERALTIEDRVELVRGLTAEFATAQAFLPRSKKPLPFKSDGTYDKKAWLEVGSERGPAARVGDLIKITKVTIKSDRILLQINGGMKGGRKWYDRIQVGMGRGTTPVSRGSYSLAPSGTNIGLLFPGRIPTLRTDGVKKILSPILDFNMRSATEQYVEKLPPEIQTAIKENKAVEGMNKEQVLLALGRPRHKIRETKDGVQLEDWIFGTPPGRIVFVTFEGDKVVRVKETYAGLGGEVAPPLKTPR